MNNCIYITSNYCSDIHVNIIYLCDMMMILSENSATTEKHVLSLGLCPAGQVFSMWPECRHLIQLNDFFLSLYLHSGPAESTMC